MAIQIQTIISICFENYLATHVASSHHCGVTCLQNLAWQHLKAPNPVSFSSQQHPHQLQIHEVQSWAEEGCWFTPVYPARHHCGSDQSSVLFLRNRRHRHVFRNQVWASTTRNFRWQSPCCCFVHQDMATSVSAVRSERLHAPAGRKLCSWFHPLAQFCTLAFWLLNACASEIENNSRFLCKSSLLFPRRN